MRNSHLRFLIVDDFGTARRIIGKLLREIGFTQADEAVDGQAALDMLLNARYDFVIADVDMPRLNGFDLTAAMRQHPTLQSIPVLLVTREPSKEEVVRASHVRANGYVVLPLTRAGLEARVRSILGLSALTAARRPGFAPLAPGARR